MTQIYQPFGHTVLVRLQKIDGGKINEAGDLYIKPGDEELTTESGLVYGIKKKEIVENEQNATVKAYVIAIGSTANRYLDSHDGTGIPEYFVGDLVMICKYGGRLIPDIYDKDEIYRLVKDNDILGLYHGQEIDNVSEAEQLVQAMYERKQKQNKYKALEVEK